MREPETPEDELARLETLEALQILDTPPEERFDRVTRMSRRLFDVPIALVSLVDENRQWFKSAAGLDAQETPRNISFCGHAILDDEIFVVNDAKRDERFSDNPLVTNTPSIRFYAGAPLKATNGARVGTLCIIDEQPRELSSDEQETLQDLAVLVEQELAAEHMATMDELTGISNRRGFLSLCQHSLRLAARQAQPATLVFIDLDEFKPINDTFGHAEGDLALKAFADLMLIAFRETDLIARLGGDEFVVLFSNATRQQTERILSKFQASVDTYNREAERGYDIVFSHGVVQFDPECHRTVEEILQAGDKLMYADKNQEDTPD